MAYASSHPIERLPLAAENPASVAFVDALQETSEILHGDLSEYAGMTLYGSTVRGDTTPESDVDLYVFMDISEHSRVQSILPPKTPIVTEVTQGETAGTVYFKPLLNAVYKKLIADELSNHGFSKADITVLPMSKEIVSSSIGRVLEEVEAIQAGQTRAIAPLVPRNIRCLFQASIDNVRLQPYCQQVLDGFAASQYGTTAWNSLRQWVAWYETAYDADKGVMAHRLFPETLDDARIYYGDTGAYSMAVSGVSRALAGIRHT